VSAADGPAAGPGRRLADRYQLLSPLGADADGELFLARDEQLSEDIAVRLLPAWPAAAAGQARLVEGARRARLVTHPGVCRVFDLCVEGPLAFLTLERLDGESLDARLRRGPLGLSELAEVFSQLASGLAACHQAGLVHGALTPASVQLMPRPGGGVRVVLASFGLARQGADGTAGPLASPAPWPSLAPGERRGEAPGPAADVHALGVMLFEAASGRLPAEDAPGPALRALAPELPRGLEALVARCLAPAPGDRPQMSRLAGELQRWRAPARGGRRWLGAVAGVAALALVALGARHAWTLPGEVRLELDFAHDFPGDEAWAGRGARRMLERRLGEDRRLTFDARGGANTLVGARLTRPAGGGVALQLTARRAGLGLEVFRTEVSAPSVTEAYARALPPLLEVLSRGRPQPPWTAAELEEARRAGAASPEGLRLHRRVNVCLFSTTVYAGSECQALANALVDAEPAWPRAWLALATLADRPGPVCARALERTAHSPDTLGRASLRTRCGERVVMRGDEFDGSDPALIGSIPWFEQRQQMAVVFIKAFEAAPELVWGDVMRDHVSGALAANVMRQWEERAPEAVQRLVDLGDLHAAELGVLLHGPLPALQAGRVRAHLEALAFTRAREAAEPMVASAEPLVRLAGLLLTAEATIYLGELGPALKLLEAATELSDSLNPGQPFFYEAYQALRGTARLLGDDATWRTATEGYLRRRGPGNLVLPYELAAGRCPPVPLVHPDPLGVNRELHALAYLRGCGRCEDVLAVPMTEEPAIDLVPDRTVLAYMECARHLGQYQLAVRAHAQTFAGRLGTLTDRRRSPVHTVLAQYELARTLEAMGRTDEALAAWTTAARFWQHLDHPRPEPQEARDAIERLTQLRAPSR